MLLVWQARILVVDCPEKVENKDNYKHKLKTDVKYCSGVTKSTSTRASTRTSDDRGRKAEARPER
jgi:hypothetical protein